MTGKQAFLCLPEEKEGKTLVFSETACIFSCKASILFNGVQRWSGAPGSAEEQGGAVQDMAFFDERDERKRATGEDAYSRSLENMAVPGV